jgi:hypothetical protein
MSPLSDTLRARVPDFPLSALNEFARQAGVPPKLASLAKAGKPVNAGAHLALCAAVGIDPVDGRPRPVKELSPNVVWWLLSSAMFITRNLKKLNQRAAAEAIGISVASVCRVERGQPVSINSLIKVCSFVQVHPDGFTAPLVCPPEIVPRGTGPVTSCFNSDADSGITGCVVP